MAYKPRGRPSKPKDPLAGVTILTTEEKKLDLPKNKRDYYGTPANRNTLFRPEYCNIVKKLMAGGATKFEIAQDLGVSETTLYAWCADNPEFAASLRTGHDVADNRVELSLYDKAVGYRWTEEVKSKTFNEVGEEVEEITQITKQLPPDNSAIFFWLKNRRGHRWKDKHEVTMTHNVNLVNTNDLHQLVHQSIVDGEYTVVEDNKT